MQHTILGNYRVTNMIGKGGMGAVYRAEHVLLGKPAAIKVLLPEFSSNPAIVQRFFNEARAASSIRHPGIVEVFDYGHDESGNAFIVMECLEGEPLSRRLARTGRIEIVHGVRLLKQIAGALGAAHKAGITHRDLKPDNIFLTPDPDVAGGERAKILDFGIAKLAGELSSGGMPTRTGLALGTPKYMAPEQFRNAKDVDHRADLYSLGCIAYAMLCGQPPFTGDSIYELCNKHVSEQPCYPSIREPSIPPLIELVILSLLAKDPENRPTSVDDLMVLLNRASDPRTSTAFELTRPTALDAPTEVSGHGPLWPLGGHASAAEQAPTTMSQAIGAIHPSASTHSWKLKGIAALALVACTAGGGALTLLFMNQASDGGGGAATHPASAPLDDIDQADPALPADNAAALSLDEIEIVPSTVSGEPPGDAIADAEPREREPETQSKPATASREPARSGPRTRSRRTMPSSSQSRPAASQAQSETRSSTTKNDQKQELSQNDNHKYGKNPAQSSPKDVTPPAEIPQKEAPATDCSRANRHYTQYRESVGKDLQALQKAIREYELCGDVSKASKLREALNSRKRFKN